MTTRRQALQIGGLATLGLSLPELIDADDRHAPPRRQKHARSCILFFMEGGPAHIDLWDPKPSAPVEIRGKYNPISTSIPGLQISERLPHWAPIMKHLSLVRSVSHNIVDHNASSYYTVTGQSPLRAGQLIRRPSRDNFPPIGSVLAHLKPTRQPLPDFIHIPQRMFNCGSFIPGQLGGFLGFPFDPFITGDPSSGNFQVPGLQRQPRLSAQRLDERRNLLSRIRRDGPLDTLPVTAGFQGQYQRAYDLITSPHARRAFQLEDEPARVRTRYGALAAGRDSGKLAHLGSSLLLARRLIEAGVRLVTVWAGRQVFDTHRGHYAELDNVIGPPLDRAFSALVEDLAERGLLDETLVVALGEFGRTPRLGQITSSAGATADGRDHWARCYSVLLGGGPIPAGQLFGASDTLGAYPARNPVTPGDIAATIYQAMGLDPQRRLRDPLNRPHTLAAGNPITPLLGG